MALGQAPDRDGGFAQCLRDCMVAGVGRTESRHGLPIPWTAEELADQCRVAPRSVRHWLKGGGISRDRFELLLDALTPVIPTHEPIFDALKASGERRALRATAARRRLAAVLVADLAGYSRLTQIDEEGTHDRLNQYRDGLLRPAIEHRSGRIVRFTGDGLLAEYASVVEAVACAIEIQRAVAARNADVPEHRRLWFRLGINLGDIIVETEDIYGNGVNVAARLEGLAEPGGIVISGTVFDQVEHHLDCEVTFVGEPQLKNIDQPVRAYRVHWQGAPTLTKRAPGAPEAPAAGTAAAAAAIAPPFVVPFKQPSLFGRADLLAAIDAAFDDPTSGRKTALTGPGGVGKTQLAALYAHSQRNTYAGGVFWLNLAGADGHALVRQIAGSFAPTLGLTSNLADLEARDRDLAEQWLGRIRNRRDVLVVADDVTRPELLWQLDALPNSNLLALDCAVLVTSRQRDLPECRALGVEPLSKAAAEALLLTEAGRHLGALDPAEVQAVERISAMLSGLPLTLRLAGALVRAEAASFARLADALEANGVIETLDAAPSPLNDYRHNVTRALTTLIEESLDHPPGSRADLLDVLRAAALFPESSIFRVASLRHLVTAPASGLGDPVAKTLAELYRRHLIEHPDDGHTTVRIHPLIHQYVAREIDDAFVRASLDHGGQALLRADLRQLAATDLVGLGRDLTLLPDLPGADGPAGSVLKTLQQTIMLQAPNLDGEVEPLVQLHYQALRDGHQDLATSLGRNAAQLPMRLGLLWSTGVSDPAQIRVLKGHGGGVNAGRFHPDGRTVLSGADDQTLMLWDVASGAPLRTMAGHTTAVWGCTFGPDGCLALSASDDRTLALWRVDDGTRVRTLGGHKRGVYGCALSPDGRRALSGSWDHTLILWDATTGNRLKTLEGHRGAVWSCRFSPDGTMALSASDDHTMILWDLDTGRPARTLVGHDGSVNDGVFSPDGHQILSASADQSLRLWATASGATIRRLGGHEAAVTACCFSPTGDRALSAAADRHLILWDVATGARLRTLVGHEGEVSACDISPDSRLGLSASSDRTLILWDLERTGVAHNPMAHRGVVNGCALSTDRRQALSASSDRTLILWDAATGTNLRTLAGHEGVVRACAFGPEAHRALSASWDRTLIFWDLATGEPVCRFEGHESWVNGCDLSGDGREALSASADQTLIRWDTATGDREQVLAGHQSGVNACVITHDGARVLSASDDRTLILWDLAAGTRLTTLAGHDGAVNACALSPDGRQALSASDDRRAIVWDLRSGASVRTLAGHTGRIVACIFGPDGRRALTASEDRALIVWDLTTGARLTKITLDGLSAATWSRDGLWVFAGNGKGDVSLLELAGPNH